MRLLLIRHGEAIPGQDDFSRPLSTKGRTDISSLGKDLAAREISPRMVFCSDAKRTFETYEHLSLSDHTVIFSNIIYKANHFSELIELVATHPQHEHFSSQTIAIIGHNPTISALASHLVGDFVGFNPGEATLLECSGDDWEVAIQVGSCWKLKNKF